MVEVAAHDERPAREERGEPVLLLPARAGPEAEVDEGHVPWLARLDTDLSRLADELGKAYLKQIAIDGHFHADPHPGNIFLVLSAEENPRTPADIVANERRTEHYSRVLHTMLHGVTATDPLTFGAVVVVTGLVTVVASVAPAIRAARVDPNAVLRVD